jgi:hypothetical protein
MLLVVVFVTFLQDFGFGFELGTSVSSCIRILIGSHSPPSSRLLRSFIIKGLSKDF